MSFYNSRRALQKRQLFSFCIAWSVQFFIGNAMRSGERQRVFIARALAQQLQILLLDEPTSSEENIREVYGVSTEIMPIDGCRHMVLKRTV